MLIWRAGLNRDLSVLLRCFHPAPAALLLCVLSSAIAQGCSPGARTPDIRVAAATNIKPALELIETTFEVETGLSVSVTYGATGKLTAQILAGAPFDVFLAADEARPNLLEQRGIVVDGTLKPYAEGGLMVWLPKAEQAPGSLAAALADPSVRHIAIANPDLAPYGLAAKDVLANIGLADTVEAKLVFGENIGQAFALVASGNADAGFIAASQSGRASQTGQLIAIDRDLHSPILQSGVVLERATDNADVLLFHAFIYSAPSHAILASHGYGVP